MEKDEIYTNKCAEFWDKVKQKSFVFELEQKNRILITEDEERLIAKKANNAEFVVISTANQKCQRCGHTKKNHNHYLNEPVSDDYYGYLKSSSACAYCACWKFSTNKLHRRRSKPVESYEKFWDEVNVNMKV